MRADAQAIELLPEFFAQLLSLVNELFLVGFETLDFFFRNLYLCFNETVVLERKTSRIT
jgi:hypothetical protein